jgi:DNA-directed RNA polymerase specialized sigma24 family protein
MSEGIAKPTDEGEEAAISEGAGAEFAMKAIDRRIRQSLDNLSEAERKVVTLWGQGDNLKAIAEKTGASVETTRRTLKKVQRMIVDELFEEMDEIAGKMRCEQEEVERLQTETRSNISELLRMVAA